MLTFGMRCAGDEIHQLDTGVAIGILKAHILKIRPRFLTFLCNDLSESFLCDEPIPIEVNINILTGKDTQCIRDNLSDHNLIEDIPVIVLLRQWMIFINHRIDRFELTSAHSVE